MSLFPEFDSLRSSVHQLFNDFESDYLDTDPFFTSHLLLAPTVMVPLNRDNNNNANANATAGGKDEKKDDDNKMAVEKVDANGKSPAPLANSNNRKKRAAAAANSLVPSYFNTITSRVDVSEDEHNFRVRAEMAGIPKENINVEVTDGILTLKGERKEEKQEEDKDRHYHYQERSYKTVQRSLRLPNNIDSSKVGAKYENGLLTVTIPKLPKPTPNKITIE